MVRAKSTYTFSSLVKASTMIDLSTYNPISGRNTVIAGWTVVWTLNPAVPGYYDLLIDANPRVTAQNLTDLINAEGQPGVQYAVTQPLFVAGTQNYTAFHDGVGHVWVTAKEYGEYSGVIDPTNSDLVVPDVNFTGERGIVEDDYVRIGSHNYRFVSSVSNPEDRILLEHDGTDEENVTAMRDRLLEAMIADPDNSHKGIYYGAETQPHQTVIARAIGDDGIEIIAKSPGRGGNEIELKDSGDGAWSNGAYLSGGAGDYDEWVEEFVEITEMSAEVVEGIRSTTVAFDPDLRDD